MRYVSEFNQLNQHYVIEVVRYAEDDLIRLRTELITGRGPDIIYSLYYNDSVLAPVMDRGMLADLWPYIDSDPDINREDFFQNILHAMQSPDGALQVIANQFAVLTLISIPEIISDPDSLTANRFLELVRRAISSGVMYPMDEYWTGIDFFTFMLLHVDLGIIDFGGGTCNFESQVVYDLLELASLLPREVALEPDHSLNARMTRGEQLVKFDSIANPYGIAKYETLLEEFTILGLPSDEGSLHSAVMRSYLGINKNSDHPEAAWSFIRRYLLPASHMDVRSGLPMRVDLFDRQIELALSGLETWILRDGGLEIPMNALTENGATQLREIVESVSFISSPNDIIANIIMEELPTFFAGRRSAGEVASIMQNRVQTYLHERG